MKYFKLFIAIFFICVGINYSQVNKQQFQVDFNEIQGELTSKDLYKKDFGRYHGYEIELYEGEAINFVVYTKNFQPSIAFVNPNGEIYQQSSRNDKGYANIVTIVPKSGNWVLYVIGDQSSRGSYTLQSAIAEPNSLSLDKDADFCITLNFLLAHSNAYFFLLENSLSGKQLVKMNGAVDSFLDEESGSYNAVFYDGNDIFLGEHTGLKIRVKPQFLIDPVTAYLSKVVSLVREKEFIYDISCSCFIGWFSISKLTINIYYCLLFRVAGIFLKCVIDYCIV